MTRPALLALATCALVVAPGVGAAQSGWREAKCANYKATWADALARLGTAGLARTFLDANARFMASDCEERPAVCPRSEAELRIANVMVVASMNAGTASTFPPFRCGET